MVGNTKSLYLFSFAKEPETLARAEIERYYSTSLHMLTPGIALAKLSTPPTSINNFGYTQLVAKVVYRSPVGEYVLAAKKIQSPYKLDLFQTKKLFTDVKQFADSLHPHITNPVVDLHNPQHEYLCVFTSTEFLLAEIIAKNTDQAGERKAHKKKHLHPTSLDPRLAKAMIALSAKESFHDSFCGVGGLVIEGAILGKHASGSDIVTTLLDKAKENAIDQGILEPNFFVADATTVLFPSKAYISDLPYGKNSLLSEDKEELFLKFFLHAKTQTTLLVIGCDSATPVSSLAEKAGWKKEEEHKLYVHKSLSRIIYVFSLAK